MAKYKMRPVIVDAAQWFPGGPIEGVAEYPAERSHTGVAFGIIAGPQVVDPGDWIVGERETAVVIKPDIFARMYKRVED